jgi:agmatine deiminase
MNNSQFMKDIYPIAKLGNSYLLINKYELHKVGKGLGVLSIKIDISNLEINKAIDLERHLKFNPWEEIVDAKERERILSQIQQQFENETIIDKIISPLNGIKEKVYISNLLDQCQNFYSGFSEHIKTNDIELIELNGTNDIWCRDYMPVKSANGTHLLFNYDPSYLKGKWKHKHTPRENIIKILNELGIKFIPIDDVKIDGGNIVQYTNKVIMTDAIFFENGIKSDKSAQIGLIKRLEDYFLSSVLIIPHQPDDTLSHSDGAVRFLDEKTVLVNNFSAVTNLKFRESKHYLDNFFGALGKSGLNIIQVPYEPIELVGEDEMAVALGIYINYLETKDFIFLPQFGKELAKTDSEALEMFRSIFKTKKEVIPVDSRTIAMKGGVLNCITWN